MQSREKRGILDHLNRDGGMMNIFRTIGCIGDSLSSGEFEYDAGNGQKGYWDCYEYSWGKQIERSTGIQVTNYSRGGLTAHQLYREADQGNSPIAAINGLFRPENGKQAYFLALGVNDLKGKDVLENVYGGRLGDPETDICLQDYRQNPQTFVGEYGRIIQRLQAMEPEAKFFLVTIPREPDFVEKGELFAETLWKIAGLLPNCHVIDLYHEGPEHDEAFRRKYFAEVCGGHMNAMGYLLTAWQMMTYVDWLIREDPEAFRYVQFTGSPYRPFPQCGVRTASH